MPQVLFVRVDLAIVAASIVIVVIVAVLREVLVLDRVVALGEVLLAREEVLSVHIVLRLVVEGVDLGGGGKEEVIRCKY